MNHGYELIDGIVFGQNTLHCSCGQRIYPDCDISSVSIRQEFALHLHEAHNVSLDNTPVGGVHSPYE